MENSRDDFVIAIRSAFLKKGTQQRFSLFVLIAFILSILFSMAGAGSGIALIPVLHFFGIDFTLAKAVGLFSGFSTTVTSTLLNIRRKAVDLKVTLPLAVTLLIFAPIGAQLSRFANPIVVNVFLLYFLSLVQL